MNLIQDLRDGKICLRNDGTPTQLEMVIKKAFPQDGRNVIPYWRYLYWGKHPLIYNSYGWSDDSSFSANKTISLSWSTSTPYPLTNSNLSFIFSPVV